MKDKALSFEKRRDKFINEVNEIGKKYGVGLNARLIINSSQDAMLAKIFVIDLEENKPVASPPPQAKPKPKEYAGLINPADGTL